MPTLLLAHANPEEAEPIAKALHEAGWAVLRKPDAVSALAEAERGKLTAALVADPLADVSRFILVDRLRAAHPTLPVIALCRTDAPGLEAHKASATAARGYLDRSLPPGQIASELLRAVRTVSGTARPSTGQQAVMAALAELETMRPDPARPPTPQNLMRTDLSSRAELEALHRRVRELELERLVHKKEVEKRDAEHKLALSSRDEMVRHLELALEALTADLSNAGSSLAEQQDRAGLSEGRLMHVESELKQVSTQLAGEVGRAHELRKELGDTRSELLAAELDVLGLREALQRAMGEAQAIYQRAMEAEAQRADLIRAVEAARVRAEHAETAAQEHKLALEAASRELTAEQKHREDAIGRLKKKLVKAEASLERLSGAQQRVAELEALLAAPARAARG